MPTRWQAVLRTLPYSHKTRFSHVHSACAELPSIRNDKENQDTSPCVAVLNLAHLAFLSVQCLLTGFYSYDKEVS